MHISKVSWSVKGGCMTLFGRLKEIDAVLKTRHTCTTQGPRKLPGNKPYWIDVEFEWRHDQVMIKTVYIKLTECASQRYCFFEDGSREGEVLVNAKLPFKQYYLDEFGSAISQLTKLIRKLEDQHELRRLVRSGPDIFPEIEADEVLEERDLMALGDEQEDLAKENLEA
jgi:hypothetical protein